MVEIEKDGVQRLVFDLKTGQMTKMAAETEDRDAAEVDREERDKAREDEDSDEDEEDENAE